MTVSHLSVCYIKKKKIVPIYKDMIQHVSLVLSHIFESDQIQHALLSDMQQRIFRGDLLKRGMARLRLD